MMPYTKACPKPMLPVDGKPILEHILVRAREEGFLKIFICIHYLGHQVERYFEDGRKWGVKIKYIKEKTPLGTAGAVGLLPQAVVEPVVVTNGDVLTEVKYGDLLEFHRKHSGFATMAVQLHRWEHPFGVVKIDGAEIDAIEEKPIFQAYVNAGIYVLSPSAIRILPRNKSINMPDLFSLLKIRKKKLLAYPLHEPWLDVGRPADLSRAQKITLKL
jgi:NDP-sugar pyrophosphorylase family protein